LFADRRRGAGGEILIEFEAVDDPTNVFLELLGLLIEFEKVRQALEVMVHVSQEIMLGENSGLRHLSILALLRDGEDSTAELQEALFSAFFEEGVNGIKAGLRVRVLHVLVESLNLLSPVDERALSLEVVDEVKVDLKLGATGEQGLVVSVVLAIIVAFDFRVHKEVQGLLLPEIDLLQFLLQLADLLRLYPFLLSFFLQASKEVLLVGRT